MGYNIKEEKYNIPWEDKNHNFFISFFLTFYDCLRRPTKFFNNISRQTSDDLPLIYGIVGMSIGILFFNLYHMVIKNSFMHYDFDELSILVNKLKIAFLIPQTIFLIPILSLVVIYLFSTCYHIIVYFVSKNNNKFLVSRNVICYALGSSFLLNVIPFLGFLLCMHGFFILFIIGFRRVHNLSRLSAFLILIAPVFILIFIFSFVTSMVLFLTNY